MSDVSDVWDVSDVLDVSDVSDVSDVFVFVFVFDQMFQRSEVSVVLMYLSKYISPHVFVKLYLSNCICQNVFFSCLSISLIKCLKGFKGQKCLGLLFNVKNQKVAQWVSQWVSDSVTQSVSDKVTYWAVLDS